MRSLACCGALALLGGCFSDPPAGDAAGSSTSDASTVGSSSSSDSGSTSAPTTSGDSGTTVDIDDATGTESESSGTTGGFEGAFCAARVNANAIRCSDFDDSPAGVPWLEAPAAGYDRAYDQNPPAVSPPTFLRVVRNGDALRANQPAEALLVAHEVVLTGLDGLRLRFAVRFPMDLQGLCGDRPLRVFAVQYDAGPAEGFYSVVGSVSLEGLQVDGFTSKGQQDLGSFPDLPGVTANGWRPVEVDLRLGANSGGPTITVMDAVGMETGAISIPGFGAPTAIDVDVGPMFDSATAPPTGCSYDLDDVVLLPVGSD